jgi:AcrR family transcriptional regulator
VHRGRPRAFDAEQALDAALELFWRHGYEGTSLAALTEAMGINAASLYAAFGNKEALFRRAVKRYVARSVGYFQHALARPTAKAVAEELMRGAVNQVTQSGHPGGCLLVQGALASNQAADPVRQALREVRHTAEAAIRERFERAAAEGDLPATVDPAAFARFISAFNFGVAVQAAGGASRAQLDEAVAVALQFWPEKSTIKRRKTNRQPAR